MIAANTLPANLAFADIDSVAEPGIVISAVQPGDLGSAAFAQVNAFASAEQGLKADTALQPSAIPAYSFRFLAKRKVDEEDFDLVDSVYDLKFDSDGRLVSSEVVP